MVVDKGRELVDDERDLRAGGAMEVLRAAVAVLVVLPVLVTVVVVVLGLAELVVDEVEGVFLTVGVGGGLLVDEDRDDDGFEVVVDLV
jgi:hypothetical protein